MNSRYTVFAASVAILLASCSDDSPQTPTAVSKVSVMINAAQGGEVAIGRATLTVPPGALAVDTEITAEIRAAQDIPANQVVNGSIYDFGPDGLEFIEPAVLEFDVQPGTFATPGAISKFEPNLGLWDQQGPTGSQFEPNLGLWDQTGNSGSNFEPNLGLWDQNDPNAMATGVTGFSDFATTRPGHGIYSCGVESIGTVCCWGLQVADQTNVEPIPTTSDFIDVDSGAWSDCGLKGDGTVECWGSNPPVPPTTGGFVELSMGRFHACGLKDDGTAECFMAPGQSYTVNSPSETGLYSVTSGDFHACAIQSTGSISCWGENRDGVTDAPSGMYFDVDAGARHTCAVASDGSLDCWGSEISGINDAPTGTNFTEVSVGVFGACALTDIGGVVCWGADYDIVVGTPTGSGYSQLKAKHRHACAVNSMGALECWGQDIQGSLAPPAGCTFPAFSQQCEIGFVPGEMGCEDIDECLVADACDMNATCTNLPGSYDCECDSGFTGDGFTCMPEVLGNDVLAMGVVHTCTIRAGEIYCWGENFYGQLGDGTNISSAAPVRVGTANDWVSIAAGSDHTCGINQGGELWCWGSNFSGELGDETFMESNVPVREVTNGTNWQQVSGGGAHTCALNTLGEVYCWGYGEQGQVGTGQFGDATAPTRESTNATNWARVETGGDHTCALDDMGNLSCWGANFFGQLGNDMMGTNSPAPTLLGGGPWDNVTLGAAHTCATRGGELYCWGSDISGQLGVNGGGDMDIAIPTRVGTDTDWDFPIAGGDSTCALKTSGALWCWGYNLEGQLGLGDQNPRFAPERVGMAGDWTTIELPVLGEQTCGIRESGQTLCWGSNYAGQLGRQSSRLEPAALPIDMGNWSSVSAFGGEDVPRILGPSTYACGIRNGSPWCWGQSSYDFLINGTAQQVAGTMGDINWTDISSGATHSCALQAGAPRCWGDNQDGGLGDATNIDSTTPAVPQGTANDTDWTQVSAGSGFTCGIKSGGLWCWGRGDEGQLGDGILTSRNTPLETGASVGTGWTIVSTGHTHTCAIHAGELFCWGANAFGQLGNGSNTPETSIPSIPTNMGTVFNSVTAGEEHTCAIDNIGNLLCTGDNTHGELGTGTTTASTSLVTIGAGEAPWSQISVGRDHTCGVNGSGILYCWGLNDFGQLGDGTITSSSIPVAVSTSFMDWAAVAVGDVFTCGIRAGGEVYCWGENGQGQMGDGSVRSLVPTPVLMLP